MIQQLGSQLFTQLIENICACAQYVHAHEKSTCKNICGSFIYNFLEAANMPFNR